MSFTFTNFVGASDPDRELCGAVLEKLRGILRRELKRRSMWNHPPSYLGIYGSRSWSEGDALEELAMDCFVSILCERLPSLRRVLELSKQTAAHQGIEGLVVSCIKNFIYDRGRGDLIGYNSFRALHAVVSESLQGGEPRLFVLQGNPLVRSNTILGFSPDLAVPRAWDREKLAGLVRIWNSDLLPELITAQGKARRRVIQGLLERLLTLPENGVETFRFQDLLSLFKSDVRRRWHSVWQEDLGETAIEADGDAFVLVRRVGPPTTFEDREGFRAWLDSVDMAIERLAESEKTRRHLRILWVFIKSLVMDEDRESFSQRKASELLGISRPRLKTLMDMLRDLVGTCRRSVLHGIFTKDFDKE